MTPFVTVFDMLSPIFVIAWCLTVNPGEPDWCRSQDVTFATAAECRAALVQSPYTFGNGVNARFRCLTTQVPTWVEVR